MLLLQLLRHARTSHAFSNSRLHSRRSAAAAVASSSTSSSSSSLNSIESRELRFYRSSPFLTESAAGRNIGTIANGSTATNTSTNPSLASLIQNIDDELKASRIAKIMQTRGVGKSSGGTGTGTSSSTAISSVSTGSSGGSSGGSGGLRTGATIQLTKGEQELFNLLTEVINESEITSTLRVAGGWVRDKLLATEDFKRGRNKSQDGSVDRLTSKFKGPSSGRQGSKLIGINSSTTSPASPPSLVDANDIPVDIDIALDDMLGREFADHLNDWLTQNGRDKISVGVVLKNPEKSKHLETATMKVGKFWIDFVNLRAEEYTEDSRIPDLMRIGTAEEDSFRRDLTINSLFYNINTGEVEDLTGKGVNDLRRGIVATPLPALTTLLDDPLRVLRSVRFAARLRFTMDESLRDAAMTESVRIALAQKVARERVGSEVDLMLRSQDPVGAMRLLINLNLAPTVFPIAGIDDALVRKIFDNGLNLLSTTHDHLCDCKISTPVWCQKKNVLQSTTNGVNEVTLIHDEESRRRLWYASFLKPLRDHFKTLGHVETVKAGARQGKKASRSVIMKLMVDELKRPLRDAEAVELVMKAADDFTGLMDAGCDLSATACLLGNIRVVYHGDDGYGSGVYTTCHMGASEVDSDVENDPVWKHAMEFRLLVSKVLQRVGPLWRAALILSLSEQLSDLESEHYSYTIEGDVVSHGISSHLSVPCSTLCTDTFCCSQQFEESQGEVREGIIERYDAFAASILSLGLVGIWSELPLINGKELLSDSILPNAPKGPAFREIMDEQTNWMVIHPGGTTHGLVKHLRSVFHDYI